MTQRLTPAGGHPLASSAIRLMASLARDFERTPRVRYGITTMCMRLGMGRTLIWENDNAAGSKA